MSRFAGVRARLRGHAGTRALGELLGRSARHGDVLGLRGPLGAGKTTLTQGLAKGLDVPPDVPVRSPTFTLCNEVPGRLLLLHYDLYRLGGEDEADEIGFRDRVGVEGVAVVEWADRFPELIPRHGLWVVLDHDEDARQVALLEDAADPTWGLAELPGLAGLPGLEGEWQPIDTTTAWGYSFSSP